MLSEDPETQERQISGFAAILKSNYRFKLPEDTNEPPVPVNEKGDPLEDASFNRRTFSEIAQRENIFGVHQFDPKKKSPEATKTNQRPTVTQVGEIKGDADYMARMRKAKTREEKEAIRDAYKSQQEAAAAAKA